MVSRFWSPRRFTKVFFLKKICSQFFARFSLSKLSVKFCSPYDEISFYMKEAKHSSYRTHQKLFSYHMYNWFKFEPKQNFMYFFMISSILSFNQPRLKINSLTFCNMIFTLITFPTNQFWKLWVKIRCFLHETCSEEKEYALFGTYLYTKHCLQSHQMK